MIIPALLISWYKFSCECPIPNLVCKLDLKETEHPQLGYVFFVSIFFGFEFEKYIQSITTIIQ